MSSFYGNLRKKIPVLQDKEISLSLIEQNINPDEGYDGISSITIPAINYNWFYWYL